MHWGYYDSRLEPVLRVKSGDEVDVETVNGEPDDFEPGDLERAYRECPNLRQIHERVEDPGVGPHILTGPIEVEEAAPGDVISIQILDLKLPLSFGWNMFSPDGGALPGEFPRLGRRIIEYDKAKKNVVFSPHILIPVAPFFGHAGVAPPPQAGRVSSLAPGRHGGNLDVKAITQGTTLYLPVNVPGALLSLGDGHAVQGDGEVCYTAVESNLDARIRIGVSRDFTPRAPISVGQESIITFGFHSDLDEATKDALHGMLDYLVEVKKMSREDAYVLSSLAVDLHISQVVNGTKGVHAVLPKSIFH